MTAYHAVALQARCVAVNATTSRDEARALMLGSLDRIKSQVNAAITWVSREDCKLIVLPEYFLTGFPLGDGISAWAEKAALDKDGPEFETLGQIAQDARIYLAGNAFEIDPLFKGLYFQSSFVIDPSGAVILRYRRLNSMFSPTPHDVWDRYLDAYGLDGVFPVARTPIGNLAAVASEEILYPEVARCMTMRGAEVLLHSTSQANETAKAVKEVCTVARAAENMAYVVSANSGGITGTPFPESSVDGGSKIVDPHGVVIAKTGFGESLAWAEIDLTSLRRFRQRPGMENVLSRQRFEAYAASYAAHHFYPPNTMADGVPERSHFLATQRETIRKLVATGLIEQDQREPGKDTGLR